MLEDGAMDLIVLQTSKLSSWRLGITCVLATGDDWILTSSTGVDLPTQLSLVGCPQVLKLARAPVWVSGSRLAWSLEPRSNRRDGECQGGLYLAYREFLVLITIRSVPHGHGKSMERVLTHGRRLGAMRGE